VYWYATHDEEGKTRFGGENVEHKNIPRYSMSGVCYTTTCGTKALNHTTCGTTHGWINCCKNDIDNFQSKLQGSRDSTLDAYNGIYTITT
jgi:hypothetical protein